MVEEADLVGLAAVTAAFELIAYALDEGRDRLAPGSLMRPWIQGFYYNGDQVRAQIDEAEARGAGWIIWNAFGDYRRDWLPPQPSS